MDRIVAIAVNRRYLMVGLFAVVIIGGLIAFKQLNIEAYPDPTPPMPAGGATRPARLRGFCRSAPMPMRFSRRRQP